MIGNAAILQTHDVAAGSLYVSMGVLRFCDDVAQRWNPIQAAPHFDLTNYLIWTGKRH
jgi:hypothetical protein